VSDYQDGFYERYERDYIPDHKVREAHNWIFSIARQNPSFRRVVDLGCGKSQEFRRFLGPSQYVGIDNSPATADLVRDDYRIDYRLDYRTIDWQGFPLGVTAFVSLFSSEITAGPAANYELYERIMLHDTIRAGLVSGFYYTDRRHENPVVEEGGVTSFQTLEDIESVRSELFEERRIYLPVPSPMFGPNVIEVWKFFTKRS
jgi:SAM-dependent methyltransferase